MHLALMLALSFCSGPDPTSEFGDCYSELVDYGEFPRPSIKPTAPAPKSVEHDCDDDDSRDEHEGDSSICEDF
jgi:hypothetical protein